MMGTMREIRYEEFGGPEVLTLHEDAPEPVPGPGELLVRVEMIGLNPLDGKIRDGSSGRARHLQLPAGTGRELVGTVLGGGEGLDEYELAARGVAPGTVVFGMRNLEDARGTAADLVAIAADDVAPVPLEALPDQLPQYAGLALAGLTALAAIEDAGELQAGADVLIHGGSGGVGQLLVQIALQKGARRVWATGRAQNAERIRALGAEPIPYDQVDWRQTIQQATGGRGVDLVLDTHYFTTFEPSFDVLAEGGRIVVLPSLADLAPARERGVDARIPRIVSGRERLDRLVALQRNGHCDVEVSEVLPLASIAEGQRRLHEGHTRGKIVVDLRGGRGE